MKKVFAFLLAMLVVMSFVGCKKTEPSVKPQDKEQEGEKEGE